MNIEETKGISSERSMLLLALGLLALLTGVAIFARPMTPIDETRYISVAWEMWLRGDWLVPYKNGAPYSHKPPLMMWLYQIGWAIFGVSEWWPRLVSPLFSASGLFLTMGLAHRLWPKHAGLGGRAVLILASSLLWIFFSTSAMFDVMLACFTLLGLHGILTAAEGRALKGFALLGLAIGLGVLAKGPVILLHTLPVAVLAPWWNPGLAWKRWAAGVVGAVLLGAAIALAWAIPAGFAGGEEYQRAIFWGQTADRMVQSFAHKRPLWWYLPLLPIMFFPWLVWPGLWRAYRDLARQGLDRGARFCLAWMLPVCVAFSLISGKQMHYLIPIFPAFALLSARALASSVRGSLWLPAFLAVLVGAGLYALALGRVTLPKNSLAELPLFWPALVLIAVMPALWYWARRSTRLLPVLTVVGVIFAALLQLSLTSAFHADYDVRPFAGAIRQAQEAGRVVANGDFYHDQFHFAGRLRQPLVAFEDDKKMAGWLTAHPDALAVLYLKNDKRLQGLSVVAVHRYIGGVAALLEAPVAISLLPPAEDKKQ
ncbi:MAG: glycosyltransferase family 39 protein [Betaproteobacteria bacterium]|uniref:Glycosyltransferase family 39 protein n=1 Tax=Candidatus Proximibacter danicus TaxID=2954365 RepID=A0A9D7K2H6_9PROT|nr:glycosyltransferase family 39 protein [Candidatus Proximibacter danicus]